MKKFQNLKARIKAGLVTVATNVALIGSKVSANGFDEVSIQTNAAEIDPISGFNKAVGVIVTLMRQVGIVLAIWGLYEIAMGLTQEGQSQKKTQGFLWLMAGIILISIKFFLRTFGIIA